MKRNYFALIVLVLLAQHAAGQKGSAELFTGNAYLHYQHNLANSLTPKSRTGWQHIATVIKRYQPQQKKSGHGDELMNQAYVTYKISNLLSLKGGLFYTDVTGYKPSLAVQFTVAHKNGLFILVPRMDVASNRAYELFLFSEHYLTVNETTRWVARIQAMSNASASRHNRSYQLIRLGIEFKGLQIGSGITLDEYGSSKTVLCNAGVYVRKKW